MGTFSLFGAQYGFLTPAVLAAAPLAAGALIYAYKNRGRSDLMLVSSTLILEQLESKRPARQKFVPPLRFFIELAAALLLVAAAAGFYRAGKSEKVAVLIDNSFSMKARALAEPGHPSFFEIALRDAGVYINSLGSFAEVNVFSTSPRLISVTGGYASKSSAVSALRQIKTSYSGDNIEAAASRILSSLDFTTMAIFSDKEPQFSQSYPKGQRNIFRIQPLIEQRIAQNNFALSNIRLQTKSISSLAKNLSVTVTSFSKEPKEFDLVLEAFDNLKGAARVLTTRKISLDPGVSKSVEFNKLPPAEAYRAAIEFTAIESKVQTDSLDEDNEVWISSSAHKQKIVIVTPSSTAALGLDKLKALDFEYIKPDKFTDSLMYESKYSNVPFIFHGTAPLKLPAANSIIINPPEGEFFFKAGSYTSGHAVEITNWSHSHPITSYLNLPLLKLKGINPLFFPNWAAPIVSTTAGTAVFAGQWQGKRYAVFGFEIFPFKGKESPVLSILTLNTLKWIVNLNLDSGFQRVNSPFKIPQGIKTIKSRKDSPVYSGQPDIESISFTKPGLYELSDKSDRRQLLAVNYFDQNESNLLGRTKFTLPSVSSVKHSESDLHTFSDLLLKIILLLLAVDLVFSSRFAGILSGIKRIRGKIRRSNELLSSEDERRQAA